MLSGSGEKSPMSYFFNGDVMSARNRVLFPSKLGVFLVVIICKDIVGRTQRQDHRFLVVALEIRTCVMSAPPGMDAVWILFLHWCFTRP